MPPFYLIIIYKCKKVIQNCIVFYNKSRENICKAQEQGGSVEKALSASLRAQSKQSTTHHLLVRDNEVWKQTTVIYFAVIL